jgi:hypothetical protein
MPNNTNTPGLTTRLAQWIATPFTTPMDFFMVIMTVLLVATVTFAWTRVLDHMLPDKG